ncbi:phosphotransferase [Kribbella sandramycini]|uniref:Phosphotransferase n=1 Tax=Kribbella sandramycini TaxID=60450 RepID=A0A7Y4P0N3_9ACTN|nr:phosphotransferase [Kribbella sandramycini]MBB6568915.1 aminoglycoside phosphotransferase (APT) family kinase protein [Kribbella sandramycini]NOL41239.1 phosphotransferase [Kribbella sandramycini]
MSGPPHVDYRATSTRPSWPDLPTALHEALILALGTEIVAVAPSVRSGFTGGFAAPAQLADNRRAFIKAAPAHLHAHTAYQREAEVVPHLPATANAPRIITSTHAGDWFAVVSEFVEGRMPGAPWTAADFAVVTARCEAMAEAFAVSPLDGLTSFLSDVGDVLEVPGQIARGERELPTRLQPWVPSILPELAELAAPATELLAATTAAHGDLRPDNLLIDQAGACWTVDWNWLALGPRWIDWVGLLPMAQHHGIDTATAVRRSPLTADVPAEELDCFAAVVAAYMLKYPNLPPPPGTTAALREHQRFAAWTFLDWLAVRRGWTT